MTEQALYEETARAKKNHPGPARMVLMSSKPNQAFFAAGFLEAK
jgi:hypothetical protein